MHAEETVVIKTYGIDRHVVNVMKKMPVPEKYIYKFCGIDEVLACDFEMTISTLKLSVPQYILCTPSLEFIDPEDYEHLFDIWLWPLNDDAVRFYMRKLQIRIERELNDSSKERQYRELMFKMARQDYLTGLATRWYLQRYLEDNRDEKDLVCILFDLDHFKEINDTYGHQTGDKVLADTAKMLKLEFPNGFPARLGGDEFIVVLTGKRKIKDVEEKVSMFLIRLENYYHNSLFMSHLSVSAGISQSNSDTQKSIEQLLQESDRALYKAKNAGRACCKIFTDEPNYYKDF